MTPPGTLLGEVRLVEVMLGAVYELGGRSYDCRVGGISTRVIVGRFRVGESLGSLADDYGLSQQQVEDAVRWELLSSRTRERRAGTQSALMAWERRWR